MGYVYPKVKLVTTAVDPEVNHLFHILPGIGKCPICNRLNVLCYQSQ